MKLLFECDRPTTSVQATWLKEPMNLSEVQKLLANAEALYGSD